MKRGGTAVQSAKKATGKTARKSAKRTPRNQAPAAHVKRVAQAVFQQAATLGERAGETFTSLGGRAGETISNLVGRF